VPSGGTEREPLLVFSLNTPPLSLSLVNELSILCRHELALWRSFVFSALLLRIFFFLTPPGGFFGVFGHLPQPPSLGFTDFIAYGALPLFSSSGKVVYLDFSFLDHLFVIFLALEVGLLAFDNDLYSSGFC